MSSSSLSSPSFSSSKLEDVQLSPAQKDVFDCLEAEEQREIEMYEAKQKARNELRRGILAELKQSTESNEKLVGSESEALKESSYTRALDFEDSDFNKKNPNLVPEIENKKSPVVTTLDENDTDYDSEEDSTLDKYERLSLKRHGEYLKLVRKGINTAEDDEKFLLSRAEIKDLKDYDELIESIRNGRSRTYIADFFESKRSEELKDLKKPSFFTDHFLAVPIGCWQRVKNYYESWQLALAHPIITAKASHGQNSNRDFQFSQLDDSDAPPPLNSSGLWGVYERFGAQRNSKLTLINLRQYWAEKSNLWRESYVFNFFKIIYILVFLTLTPLWDLTWFGYDLTSMFAHYLFVSNPILKRISGLYNWWAQAQRLKKWCSSHEKTIYGFIGTAVVLGGAIYFYIRNRDEKKRLSKIGLESPVEQHSNPPLLSKAAASVTLLSILVGFLAGNMSKWIRYFSPAVQVLRGLSIVGADLGTCLNYNPFAEKKCSVGPGKVYCAECACELIVESHFDAEDLKSNIKSYLRVEEGRILLFKFLLSSMFKSLRISQSNLTWFNNLTDNEKSIILKVGGLNLSHVETTVGWKAYLLTNGKKIIRILPILQNNNDDTSETITKGANLEISINGVGPYLSPIPETEDYSLWYYVKDLSQQVSSPMQNDILVEKTADTLGEIPMVYKFALRALGIIAIAFAIMYVQGTLEANLNACSQKVISWWNIVCDILKVGNKSPKGSTVLSEQVLDNAVIDHLDSPIVTSKAKLALSALGAATLTASQLLPESLPVVSRNSIKFPGAAHQLDKIIKAVTVGKELESSEVVNASTSSSFVQPLEKESKKKGQNSRQSGHDKKFAGTNVHNSALSSSSTAKADVRKGPSTNVKNPAHDTGAFKIQQDKQRTYIVYNDKSFDFSKPISVPMILINRSSPAASLKASATTKEEYDKLYSKGYRVNTVLLANIPKLTFGKFTFNTGDVSMEEIIQMFDRLKHWAVSSKTPSDWEKWKLNSGGRLFWQCYHDDIRADARGSRLLSQLLAIEYPAESIKEDTLIKESAISHLFTEIISPLALKFGSSREITPTVLASLTPEEQVLHRSKVDAIKLMAAEEMKNNNPSPFVLNRITSDKLNSAGFDHSQLKFPLLVTKDLKEFIDLDHLSTTNEDIFSETPHLFVPSQCPLLVLRDNVPIVESLEPNSNNKNSEQRKLSIPTNKELTGSVASLESNVINKDLSQCPFLLLPKTCPNFANCKACRTVAERASLIHKAEVDEGNVIGGDYNVAQHKASSLCEIYVGDHRVGSGFRYADGLMTCNHVLIMAKAAQLTLADDSQITIRNCCDPANSYNIIFNDDPNSSVQTFVVRVDADADIAYLYPCGLKRNECITNRPALKSFPFASTQKKLTVPISLLALINNEVKQSVGNFVSGDPKNLYHTASSVVGWSGSPLMTLQGAVMGIHIGRGDADSNLARGVSLFERLIHSPSTVSKANLAGATKN